MGERGRWLAASHETNYPLYAVTRVTCCTFTDGPDMYYLRWVSLWDAIIANYLTKPHRFYLAGQVGWTTRLWNGFS